MNNDRQLQILQLLDNKGEVQLQQLKELFPDVSMMTLRRDLIALEAEGRLIRTHGGAVSHKKLSISGVVNGEEDSYTRRAADNVEAKLKIADKSIDLVEKGRSIYFDAGSTIMCLARILADDSYSVFTSGANIALELVKKLRTSVVLLGGLVNRNTLSTSGPDAMSSLDNVNIDTAFMASSGYSIESGFTVSNIYECELKRKIIKRARKVILLMDTSKVNKNLPFTYATLEDIDIWVTETALPQDIINEAKKWGVTLL